MRARHLLITGLLMALLGAPAEAQLYRTRDASGRTVVTNLATGRGARPVAGGTLSVANPQGGEAPRLRLVASPRIAESKVAPYRVHLQAAAARYDLPIRLLEAVVAVESDFNPKATSKKGAQGLMQLMPATARELAVDDPYDPAANIDAGARYLRRMLDVFQQDLSLALAAYNAGPSTVQAAGGVPRIAETVDYVRRVRSLFHGGMLRHGSSSLTQTRGSNGRLLLTNVGATPSTVRLLSEAGGRRRMTNR